MATKFTIWQWNCASFKQRGAAFKQYLNAQTSKPQVILTQETLTPSPIISGYKVVAQHGTGGRGIATHIAQQYSYVTHELKQGSSKIEATLVDIIPNNKLNDHIFILNVYSSPSHKRQGFTKLITKASSIATEHPFIVAGDFNAPHTAWGYTKTSKKGRNLQEAAENAELNLITDAEYPTRLGNSVARDTTPDLTF